MQSIARKRIVEVAKTWLKTPYQHQGRRKGRGIDCIGLVWGIGAELGVEAVIPHNYSASPSGDLVLQGCDKYLLKPEQKVLTLVAMRVRGMIVSTAMTVAMAVAMMIVVTEQPGTGKVHE